MSDLFGRTTYAASNPARLRVDWGKFFLQRPETPILCVGGLLFGVYLTNYVQPVVGFSAIAASFWVLVSTCRGVSRKFSEGNVCPGIVVSNNLVAALSDLRPGEGPERWAIKIQRQPLRGMTGGPPQPGLRVATAALYYQPIREGAWSDFLPEAINSVTSDTAEIQRVLDSIPDSEWQRLEQALAQIPHPAPGLYRLWGAHSRQQPFIPASQRAGKVIIGIGIALVALRIVLGYALKPHSQDSTAATSSVPASPPPAPPTSFPAEAPRPRPPGPRPGPSVNPVPVVAPTKPRTPAAVNLAGRMVSFTNLQGRVYENVKLVRADTRLLTYSTDSGGGSVALTNLPMEFLAEIGAPTNGPDFSPQPTPARFHLFSVGEKVEVQWGGTWEPATIVGFQKPNIIVHFDDPNSFFKNNLWVPTNWVRMNH
jgi:hypothetical protein